MLLSLFFSQGPTLPVHAQDATPSTPTVAPLIQHPYTFHKPVCPTVVGLGMARCNSEIVTDANGALISSEALLTGSYGPAAFLGAYGLSGSTASTRTVAIVDANDDTNVLERPGRIQRPLRHPDLEPLRR